MARFHPPAPNAAVQHPGSGLAKTGSLSEGDLVFPGSRRHTSAWRHLFVTACALLRPRWAAVLNILSCPEASLESLRDDVARLPRVNHA
jgi:hypothetical protein